MTRGRPRKQTVNYFPHYTGASDGKTMFILQNRFGNDGYAFWFKLLEILGSSEGHFFNYRKPPDWQFLLAKTGVSDDNKAAEILKTLADLEAIDVELYQHKIVWSQNFVDNLADLYKRRKIDFPRKPVVSAGNNPINVSNNAISITSNTPPSPIPPIPLNESKANDKKNNKKLYGKFQNVFLTDEEHQRLQNQFSRETPLLIERLSSYIASKGKRYKSHYATILNWKLKDKEQGEKATSPRDLPKNYTKSPDYSDL